MLLVHQYRAPPYWILSPRQPNAWDLCTPAIELKTAMTKRLLYRPRICICGEVAADVSLQVLFARDYCWLVVLYFGRLYPHFHVLQRIVSHGNRSVWRSSLLLSVSKSLSTLGRSFLRTRYFLSVQDVLCLVWNQKFRYTIHNSTPVVPTHAISSFFLTSQSNLQFSKGITRRVWFCQYRDFKYFVLSTKIQVLNNFKSSEQDSFQVFL
jgi:hypothetical protein